MKHISEYVEEVVNELLIEVANQDREDRINDYVKQLDNEERDANWLADPHNFGGDYE